jgi:acetylornithine deacetylase/succinyl-diaminopimelate desuccinylase-like protein
MSDLRSYLEANAERHLAELLEFLRIPSVSTDPERAGDVRRAGEWVQSQLQSAGVSAELHETPGHPIIYGEWLGAGESAPTVLVYGHYDVQPPEPLDEWITGPFDPEVRDGKIYARGATDDKGQMFAHIKAAEAHLAVSGRLPVNVKYLIEGEEEVGSANLEAYIRANIDRLEADVVVISDTSMFAPGVPAIVYGLRGLAYFEMTVEGPSHDLHSGLFGGTVANPINVLCDIISSLRDAEGRVNVPGFYDDVCALTEEERAAWRDLPHDDEVWRVSCGAERLDGEAGFSTLERRWGRPTLDCNGIWGGFTGQGAKTVLPSKASAKFSCRLVPDQTPEKIEGLVEAAVRELAPDTVRVTFRRMHGARPVVVDTNHPAVGAARAALTDAFGAEAVFIRGGGSIPVVADFSSILKIPSVLMGFGLPDDRLHSPNEKYDLDCFYGGLLAASLFLEHYGS